MVTSIIPSIPLYTIHYPLPLYQVAATASASTAPTNAAQVPPAAPSVAPVSAAATAPSAVNASTVLTQLLKLNGDSGEDCVGRLIDLST